MLLILYAVNSLPKLPTRVQKKVKCTPCTGTEALYRPYGPYWGGGGVGRGIAILRLCTGRTANKGSRDITLLFLEHGTRRG
jgi:hypothetical protein